jgi:hypothetical protein
MSYEKEAKAGVKKRQQKRREIMVDEHFADVLRAVITRWQGEKTLVLAMDASALGDRLTILSLSIQYRGCAMRVAWTILPGGEREHGDHIGNGCSDCWERQCPPTGWCM